MIPLYVISIAPFAGKSAMCVGLGRKLREDGVTIGYMKPVSPTGKEIEGVMADEDAHFMKQVFSLLEPLPLLSPVVLTSQLVGSVLAGKDVNDYASLVQSAFDQVAAHKDVVLLEGAAGITEGAIIKLSVYELAKLLEPKILLVVRYTDDLSMEVPLLIKSTMGDALVDTLTKFSQIQVGLQGYEVHGA